MRGLIAALGAVVFIASAPAAQADVQPYAANDAGGFHDVLPPGANGLANGVELAAFLTTGARPAHSDDQLAMYRDLMYATPGLKAAGPRALLQGLDLRGQARRRRDDHHAARRRHDRARQGLRRPAHLRHHARRRRCSAPATRPRRTACSSSTCCATSAARSCRPSSAARPPTARWTPSSGRSRPTRRPTTSASSTSATTSTATAGRQLQDDALNYVAGINQYIAEARLDPTKMPGEYAAIGRPQGPDDWKVTDLFATASLVGGIFGKGGGRELAEAQLLDAFKDRFGAKKGRTLWEQFAAFDDPDAPTTVKGRRFPYQTQPKQARAKGAEEPPDPGSFKALEVVALVDGAARDRRPAAGRQPAAPPPRPAGVPSVPGRAVAAGAAVAARRPRPARARPAAQGDVQRAARLGRQLGQRATRSRSSARRSAYFAPQILMEEDLHGPGIDAKGAAFPGVNLYVQLGHGRDYAWSATSAGQDIIDTFAVPLCDATHYRFRGQCLPIEELERKNAWTPNLADQTPAGAETLHAERTKLGLVAGRGTYKGKPMLYTVLRSTYQHEVDSAVGFSLFNEPGAIRSPQDFQRAAGKIGYTFNWFYIDAKHIAYFNSRQQPGAGEGDDRPAADGIDERVARLRPRPQHGALHAVRPAPAGRRPAGAHELEQPPGARATRAPTRTSSARSSARRCSIASSRCGCKGGHKLTLPEMVDAMEQAGTTDLRGMTSLPLALRIVGHAEGPGARRGRGQAQGVVGQRHAPHRPRPRRRLRRRRRGADHGRVVAAAHPGHVPARHGQARCSTTLEATYQIDNEPNNHGDHLGSAYQEGFYGYVLKDLKRVLKRPVAQKYAAAFCGRGKLDACRKALRVLAEERAGREGDRHLPGRRRPARRATRRAWTPCASAPWAG